MAQERREHRKRLSIDIPTQVHDYVKRESIDHNCTVTSFVIRALIEKQKRDEQYK